MSVRKNMQRGDTLIEVLMAISITGIVIVSSISVMNKGVASMYDSMERIEVRQLMNRQIETLIYARDQYAAKLAGSTDVDGNASNIWDSMAATPNQTSVPAVDNCNPKDAFATDKHGTSGNIIFIPAGNGIAGGFPKPGDGLWVQKISNSTIPVKYVDFYVRACWQPTSSQVTQVLSSVVRLYVP